jgi:hypothetical protein
MRHQENFMQKKCHAAWNADVDQGRLVTRGGQIDDSVFGLRGRRNLRISILIILRALIRRRRKALQNELLLQQNVVRWV